MVEERAAVAVQTLLEAKDVAGHLRDDAAAAEEAVLFREKGERGGWGWMDDGG
jgi:hypothetical protein